MTRRVPTAVFSAVVLLLCGGAAWAAGCQKEANFDAWLDNVKKEAAADGVSQNTIDAALTGVHFDQGIIDRDRAQQVFAHLTALAGGQR